MERISTEATTASLAKPVEEKIKRFDIHQIIQHAWMMVSFILLVVTGFPLKFSEWAFSQWWVGVWGGIDAVRSVHHVSAYAIVIVCIYHLLYLGYNSLILRRPIGVKMIPSIDDFSKLLQEVSYFMGISKERPEYDRFSWKEKFDYWAIFWGMPVMGGSGFILMYPVFASKVLPGWMIPAAMIAHSDEAMLALSWIFLVHIFFNHFSPGIFPINTSIFTGKVATERYAREHPLEYRSLTGEPETEEGTEESKEQA
ncbi:MAG: cytochrome b/b6 domain-containing protein [Chloroflexi bacterium]|nr:cytochrome b/b6 domain-containing protein [Chloroflexota bacterium]